jgi:hypothetical protein
MTNRHYVNLGWFGRYWRLLLKNSVSDQAAWERLLDQHARGSLICDPPLPADPARLSLSPPPRSGSRTLNPPRIHIRTDDGVWRDASGFAAQLLESEAGAYGVGDKPPPQPKPPETFAPGGPPPPYVSPIEREKAENLKKLVALLEREKGPPPAAEPVKKEPDAVPADTRKPSAIEDQRQNDVAPHDDKALRKWIQETCARWSRSVSEDGLNGWLRGKYVDQFGEQANEESLRRKFDRHLKVLKDYPREW